MRLTETPTQSEGRKACVNGHPWTPQTTRWRKRTRNGRTTTERDCLRCKQASETGRRQRRRSEQRQETAA